MRKTRDRVHLQRRQPEKSALYQVMQQHLLTFEQTTYTMNLLHH